MQEILLIGSIKLQLQQIPEYKNAIAYNKWFRDKALVFSDKKNLKKYQEYILIDEEIDKLQKEYIPYIFLNFFYLKKLMLYSATIYYMLCIFIFSISCDSTN